MAILALDVGKQKIGVAISRSGLLSSEYSTLHFKSPEVAIGKIILILKQENIDQLVVGLPKNMDGSPSEITHFVQDFANKLAERIKSYQLAASVHFVDERLTSKEAERVLKAMQLNREQITERRDQMAAKLILDQFLDQNL